MSLTLLILKIFLILPLVLGGVIPQQESIEDYIVGGNETKIEKIPYQIALLMNNRFLCGGSIISPSHVLTAAHCVTGFHTQKINFTVRSGSSFRNSSGVVTNVKKAYPHPEFSFYTLEYDIAVLELETPLKFNNATQPIKVGEKEPADGASVLISGWGFLKEGEINCPRHLYSVAVPIVNRKVCAKNYEKLLEITPRMICAGMEGKDACQGDSGGPMTHNGNLVGIVSVGLGCGRKDFPGIYTNIAAPEIRAFIKKQANV